MAVVVVAAVAAVAFALERRKPEPPTQARWAVPSQLDRSDFDRPDAPWLVVVFSSATCDSCAKSVSQAELLSSDNVVSQDVEVKAHPDLHRRYGIEAVPTTLVADGDGVVRASFVGPPAAAELWAAVAELRRQGEG